jgi:1,6-anhydro-N-acetylmuramate kinase
MSGTSQDGVDVALIETDGDVITRFGPTAYRSYSKPERALLRSATAAAANATERTARPDIIADAEAQVNDAHAEAVETFLAANSILPGDVSVIGFHGQTVLHRPERGLTIHTLATPPTLSTATGGSKPSRRAKALRQHAHQRRISRAAAGDDPGFRRTRQQRHDAR